MGLTKLGYDSYLQFGREAVWGTDVAATHRIPAVSIDMKAGEERFESNVLDGGPVVKTIYQGRHMATCEVEFEVWYAGLNLIWDTLMGTSTFGANGGATTGAGPYDHSWATQKTIHNSLTLERCIGGGTTGQQLTGSKIASMVISGDANGSSPLRGKAVFLGKTMTSGITLTTGLTQVSPLPVFPEHMISTGTTDGITATAADRKILSFELTIDNGLFDGSLLGSRFRAEPDRVKRAEVTMKSTVRLATTEILDAFLANTTVNALLPFASGTNGFELDPAAGKVMEYGEPIPGPEGIDVTLTVKAAAVASTGISIVATNSQALITT